MVSTVAVDILFFRSGAVPRNGGKADANIGNPPVEDDEETELNDLKETMDNEQTLTPCRANVTHSVGPSVDLDGSCSSEDITAVSSEFCW